MKTEKKKRKKGRKLQRMPIEEIKKMLAHPILWLEESLLDPPVIPGSLHVLRAVGIRHGAGCVWGSFR